MRRDDLAANLNRIERVLDEMKDEQRRTNERIDTMLATLVKDRAGP